MKKYKIRYIFIYTIRYLFTNTAGTGSGARGGCAAAALTGPRRDRRGAQDVALLSPLRSSSPQRGNPLLWGLSGPPSSKCERREQPRWCRCSAHARGKPYLCRPLPPSCGFSPVPRGIPKTNGVLSPSPRLWNGDRARDGISAALGALPLTLLRPRAEHVAPRRLQPRRCPRFVYQA